jgi:hypothetical protein
MNLRITQELPFLFGGKGRFYMNIFNFCNLLNDSWCIRKDAQFFPQQVVNNSINEAGQFVFTRFRGRDIEDVLEQQSLWEIRVGLEFNF